MTSVKSLQKQLLAAVAMVLVAAIAMSSATYAWFVNNAQVTATGAKVKAATAYSLLISNDNTNFGTTTAFDTEIASLFPVSTAGTLEATARTSISKADATATDAFDLLFAASNEWNGNYVVSFTEVGKNTKFDGTNTYYYTDTIYLKPGQDGSIYLDSSSLGVAWKTWDTTNHAISDKTSYYSFADFYKLADAEDSSATAADLKAYNDALNQAQALLATLRVGFVVTYSSNNTETLVGTYIYQLVDSNLTGYINTTALDGDAETMSAGADGIGGAVSVAPGDHTISVSASNLKGATTIVKNATSSGIPVISGITGSQSAPATATADDVAIVPSATANTVYTVDTYIWMEGCDVDTVAATLSQFGSGSIDGIQFGFCLGTVPSST